MSLNTKLTLPVIFFTAFVFISCNKKNEMTCKPVEPAAEAEQMTAFCNIQSIAYTVDTNGIYYQIIDQGAGLSPNTNSLITVTYSTSTLDGNIVEDKTTTPVKKKLNEFIEGWRIALPYIQKGGRIKMVIPSALAYGCTGIPNLIASNAPLYYDVVLINVE
jgi:FKBP-type peptidyl-prolyl cis-trans isomerase FkpA